MEILEYAISLLLDLILTVAIYMFVPIIIIIKQKKFTKKKLKTIMIFNGIGGFILFFIIIGVLASEGAPSFVAPIFWSITGYKILQKTSCLDDENDLIATNPSNEYPQYKNVSNKATSIPKDNTSVRICISPENEQPSTTGTPFCAAAYNPAEPYIKSSSIQKSTAESPIFTKTDEIHFCRKCGAKLNDNSKFCWKCGTQIIKE